MGKKTVAVCDCGCGSDVGNQGFQLSNFGMNIPFRGLKLSGDLTFVDLDHLNSWLQSALPVAERLKKTLKNTPTNHGTFSEPNFDTLYID